MIMAENIYQPKIMRIVGVREETPTIKTFRLEFVSDNDKKSWTFKEGQFGEFSVPGEGEAPFCIASPVSLSDYIEITVKEVKRVTHAFQNLNEGDYATFRGPYGNWFPIDEFYGKNIMILGGGIGIAPLRGLIYRIIEERKKFSEFHLIYAARCVDELVYKDEVYDWWKREDISETMLCVDPGGETPDWKGKVSFIPPVLEQMKLSPKNRIIVVCGPPIMIRLCLEKLEELGFAPQRIYTTLEAKMKCGLGKCGRCNIGDVYICKDGPVFTYTQIKSFPGEVW
jgi:NAD(P)H-flavin reductase